jgi:hypothetical protein
MRIADQCRDPELLAAEVRRLRTVIAAGEPTLTDAEREAIEWCLSLPMLDRDIVKMMPLRSILERMK